MVAVWSGREGQGSTPAGGATCRGDSHRAGLCPDRGRARWVVLMVQTDKGVRSDSLAFNSRHNTASVAAADGPVQTCSGARPSAGRLSGVNPRSDYGALSATLISPRSARPLTLAATDAVTCLAGCYMSMKCGECGMGGEGVRLLILTFWCCHGTPSCQTADCREAVQRGEKVQAVD